MDLMFDSWSEYRAKVLMLLTLAEGPLDWSEVDLRNPGINDPQLMEILAGYLQAPGNRQVRLLLKEGSYLVQHCPRLLSLMEKFVHRVEVRLVASSETLDAGCMMISGDMILRRFHADFARGRLESGPNIGLEGWLSRFEQLWEGAERYSAWQRISI